MTNTGIQKGCGGAKKDSDKMKTAMDKFKTGTLKDSHGKKVTEREQAIAIGLSESGVTLKDLDSMAKTELRNKILDVKKSLVNLVHKELDQDRYIRSEVVRFFKSNKNPTDTQVHSLAEKLGASPNELETIIYSIISDLLTGGLSEGKPVTVDSNELKMGVEVEREHTDNILIADKIARDHLVEDPKYYTKLKAMESK